MRKKIEMRKKNDLKTFEEGYSEFINYCKIRNLREATIKHYNDIVKYVIYKFLEKDTVTKNITNKTVEEFILFCKEKMNQNDVTVNTNLRAFRAILYYFMRLNYTEEFKISEIKVNRDIIETYTDAEINILLEKPNLNKCNYIQYRNWCICNFLLSTGCRVRTLANIRIKDLDFENQLISYFHTKNRRQQIVPMSNSLKKVLLEYLQYRRFEKEEDLLFVNAYGNPLKTDLLAQNLCNYNRKRGVMKTGIHRWRHTFAKKWILNGGDIFRLQKILGHSSMDIVKNYVEMFTNDLQKDFNTFNPLEQMTQGNAKNHISMRGGRK
jgi:integrase/recombinase XerD